MQGGDFKEGTGCAVRATEGPTPRASRASGKGYGGGSDCVSPPLSQGVRLRPRPKAGVWIKTGCSSLPRSRCCCGSPSPQPGAPTAPKLPRGSQGWWGCDVQGVNVHGDAGFRILLGQVPSHVPTRAAATKVPRDPLLLPTVNVYRGRGGWVKSGPNTVTPTPPPGLARCGEKLLLWQGFPGGV